MQLVGAHGGEVMYFWRVCFMVALGFLNCDICMCVDKQFGLLPFVFDSIYVDLQYNEISLIFTAGFVSSRSWSVCEVVLLPYIDVVTMMRVMLHVFILRG